MNKNKIFNDPVYGFINIPSEIIFDIIEHRYFQRLRRIKQLGLTDYVYPGANHTRFHHALGAMHLMGEALNHLAEKGIEISPEEREAALIAILLHDLGHGPFSHALEFAILTNSHHEDISLLLMEKLDKEMNGKLQLGISIFKDEYERKFFHQLVSSQLDIDRLDYLQRDCFFTGVSEGAIGANRIIKMLNVHQDELIVEEKGIYSIENFLNARRLMYWQVYLHKAAISSEQILISIFKRARDLQHGGVPIFVSPALEVFLRRDISTLDLKDDKQLLDHFVNLDDYDVWYAVKQWQNHPDKVISNLSKKLIDRKIFKVMLTNDKIDTDFKKYVKKKVQEAYNLKDEEVKYFVLSGELSNAGYVAKGNHIHILTKKDGIQDIADASELPNIKAISRIVRKYYLCWPKDVIL